MEIAVVFAEIACDSSLSEKCGKIATQNFVRDALILLTKTIKEHGGKILKTTDNQTLCVFSNAKKAVQAACQMQLAISWNPEFRKLDMALKIGSHFGEGVLNKNSISGEAITVAKRLRDVAKSGQIIITRDMQKSIPTSLGLELKLCGRLKVKEKLVKLDLLEVLWDEEEEENTIIGESAINRRASHSARLVLEYMGKNYELGKGRNTYLMGRGNQNDLIIDEPCVSRGHVTIKQIGSKFKIIDQSTNGTYINTDKIGDFCLHKAEFIFEGSGVICLGQKINKDYPHLIYFEMEEG